jgi:hypothetical protein
MGFTYQIIAAGGGVFDKAGSRIVPFIASMASLFVGATPMLRNQPDGMLMVYADL